MLVAFEKHLAATGKSAGTIEQRIGDIRRFSATYPDLTSVTVNDIEDYLAERKNRWAPNYRRRVLSSLVIFFTWAKREKLIKKNPAKAIQGFRVPAGIPRPAPDEIILAAFDSADLPVRAMLCLGSSSGLRRTEIATAHPKNREGATLRVLGKGSKFRIVPLDSLTFGLLRDLEGLQGRDDYYFPGRLGGHLHPATVYKRLKLQLGPDWTPHNLRHRTATQALWLTGDLRGVQEFLGHASVHTTQIYTKVGARDLIKIAEATSLSEQLIARRLNAFASSAAGNYLEAEPEMDLIQALEVLRRHSV